MTFRTLSEAADLTQDELLRGVATAIRTTNQLIAFQDPRITDRATIRGNREASLPEGQVIGCDTEIVDQKTETEPFDYPLETLTTQFTTCRKVQGLASTFTDQVGVDLAGAAKGLGRTIEQQLITGEGVAGTDMFGLTTLVPASQIIELPGNSPALTDLDHLYDIVTVRSAGAMAYIANAATRRAIATLLRQAGGITEQNLAGTNFIVPTVNGIPVLTVDWMPNDKIMLVNTSPEDEGVFSVLGQTADMPDVQNIGGMFNLVGVGWMSNRDRYRWRLLADMAQVMQSPLALGMLDYAAAGSGSGS